jgi:hypothetical protein
MEPDAGPIRNRECVLICAGNPDKDKRKLEVIAFENHHSPKERPSSCIHTPVDRSEARKTYAPSGGAVCLETMQAIKCQARISGSVAGVTVVQVFDFLPYTCKSASPDFQLGEMSV